VRKDIFHVLPILPQFMMIFGKSQMLIYDEINNISMILKDFGKKRGRSGRKGFFGILI
jgi:hypothetical protein